MIGFMLQWLVQGGGTVPSSSSSGFVVDADRSRPTLTVADRSVRAVAIAAGSSRPYVRFETRKERA